MWCPSVSLSVWANAWLAGLAAPDDVLDALSCWAPTQSVTAYDAVAAGHAGLAWPDVRNTGAVSLLQTLRPAPGRSAAISVLLPAPGDVRGLPAGTAFERDALAAGEALIVTDPDDPVATVGLVPEFGESDELSWTVYALPGTRDEDQHDLGEAEYTLRSAVRTAAQALGSIGLQAAGADVLDPRELVEELLESSSAHRVPGHAPTRALRVLETAAHVDAILAVSSELLPAATLSSSQAQIAAATLRPLTAVVRSARMAAVSAILRSAWRG